MQRLDPESLVVLEQLYREHRDGLAPLPNALRSLLRLSEDFTRRTGESLAPWEVWETIVRTFG